MPETFWGLIHPFDRSERMDPLELSMAVNLYNSSFIYFCKGPNKYCILSSSHLQLLPNYSTSQQQKQHEEAVVAPKKPRNINSLGRFLRCSRSFLHLYSCYHLITNFACRPLHCMVLLCLVVDVEFPGIPHLTES